VKKTRKAEAIGVSEIASLLPQSVWRRLVRLFRHDHDPLLVASLTAFNEPRIYLPPDFSPPLRLVSSQL
jgi:hypothetical protein